MMKIFACVVFVEIIEGNGSFVSNFLVRGSDVSLISANQSVMLGRFA